VDEKTPEELEGITTTKMKKKDILKEFERRYSSFFSQIPISQPLKFISDAIDEAEERGYKKGLFEGQTNQDGSVKVVKKKCKHKNIIPIVGFYCLDCGRVWNDKKQIEINKKLVKDLKEINKLKRKGVIK